MIVNSEKITLKIICYYLISVLTLLNGTVEWKYLTGIHFPVTLIKVALAFVIGIGILLNSRQLRIASRVIPVFVIMVLYLSGYALLSRYNLKNYFTDYVVFILIFYLFAVALLSKHEYVVFLETYENVILIIAAISIFFWLFGSVLNVLPGRSEILYYWANGYRSGYTYFNLYFENMRENQEILLEIFPRNCGVFTEVPAYSGYLLFALLIEQFAHKTVNNKKRNLLVAVIITTQSTKALLIVVVLFLFMYFQKMRSDNKTNKWIARTVLVLPIGYAVYRLASFLLSFKGTTRSYIVRLSDLYASYMAWKQHPLMGVGFNNNLAVIAYSTIEKANNGLSMGLTVLLAQGGLYLFLFNLIGALSPFMYFATKKGKNRYLIVFTVLLLNLFISNSWASIPYLFMLGSGYACLATTSKRNLLKNRRIER